VKAPAYGAMNSDAEISEARCVFMPIGPPVEPDDIGDAVAFVASDTTRSINGVNLPVNGRVSEGNIPDSNNRSR
jgi:NAD(P)-dependent dehydrogenase (short-subunit alcohol dehydrogenase family)